MTLFKSSFLFGIGLDGGRIGGLNGGELGERGGGEEGEGFAGEGLGGMLGEGKGLIDNGDGDSIDGLESENSGEGEAPNKERGLDSQLGDPFETAFGLIDFGRLSDGETSPIEPSQLGDSASSSLDADAGTERLGPSRLELIFRDSELSIL